MLLITRSRSCLSSSAVAPGLIVTASAFAANLSEVLSLAEYIIALCSAASRAAPPQEAPFLSEIIGDDEDDGRHGDMPSGDVDTDFAAMMAAVEMIST